MDNDDHMILLIFFLFLCFMTGNILCRINNCFWDLKSCNVKNVQIKNTKLYGIYIYENTYKNLEILTEKNITLLQSYIPTYENNSQKCFVKKYKSEYDIKIEPYDPKITLYYLYITIISLFMFSYLGYITFENDNLPVRINHYSIV